jgi:hypothetical protein
MSLQRQQTSIPTGGRNLVFPGIRPCTELMRPAHLEHQLGSLLSFWSVASSVSHCGRGSDALWGSHGLGFVCSSSKAVKSHFPL